MEGIADSMAKMAEEMKRMAITHTETQSMVTALTEKQASMQVQLDSQSVVSSQPGPSQLLAKKGDWTLDTAALAPALATSWQARLSPLAQATAATSGQCQCPGPGHSH